jgi:hypothetical protein
MTESKQQRSASAAMIIAIACVTVAALPVASPVEAETYKLGERKHRNQWMDGAGDVLKDIEWTTRAVVDVSSDGAKVRIEHDGERHVDKFAGVAGEIRFANVEDSLASMELVLANGELVEGESYELAAGKHQIVRIRTNHRAVDHTWSHWWSPGKPTQPKEQAIEQAGQWVQAAADKPGKVRLLTAEKVVNKLYPHGEDDEELGAAVTAIDIAREQESLLNVDLDRYINTVREAETEDALDKALADLQDVMFRNASHFVKLTALGELDVEDARRISNVVKYGVQAVDDLKDRNLLHYAAKGGGESSGLQDFMNVAYGVTALAEGVEDRDAQRILSGARNTLGQLAVKVPRYFRTSTSFANAAPHPIAGVLDLPASVAATITQVSREGYLKSADTLEHIAQAMRGDEEAAEKAVQASKKVKPVLSSENYGKAMVDAAKNRLIDRVPFLRTIVNWF